MRSDKHDNGIENDNGNGNCNSSNDTSFISLPNHISSIIDDTEKRISNHSDNSIKKKRKASKEVTMVRQINLLMRKIERSSLSECDNESNYNLSLAHKQNEFLEELNEAIMNDISLTKITEPIIRSQYNIVQKHDNYIKISLIKSNVDLKTVACEFYIGENGLSCSQKTYGRDYISFGRQQIDDQYKRPNDIMLFPTDPSISRSHLKVFYKKTFSEINNYNEKEKILLKLNIPIEFIFNILEYLKPKLSVSIEDNETIYGTYIRVKPLTYERILINLYLVLDALKSIQKTERKGLCFEDILINYLCSLPPVMMSTINSILNKIVTYLKLGMYEELELELKSINTKCFPELFLDSFSAEVKSHTSLLNDNNTVLKENMVFITSPKNGLIVQFIGNLVQLLNRINEDVKRIQISVIKIFSHCQIFDEQQYDHESSLYKLIVQTNHQFFKVNSFISPIHDRWDFLFKYNALSCIETFGDPCGIMNRQTCLIFIQPKMACYSFTKDNSFSFNLTKGFLLGQHMKKSYLIEIESNIMIYYSPINKGSWMITDMTAFLNPFIYKSIDYFGLWICTSPDKELKNRFKRTQFDIGENDQVRLSESVLRFEFNIKS